MKAEKRALICTTTPYMIRQFLMNDIKLLESLGYKVDIATNFQSFDVIADDVLAEFRKSLEDMGIKIYNVEFSRKPTAFKKHIESFRQLSGLFKENGYSLLHTHTPIASAVSRLAVRKFRKTGTKVIYTAHGFHFYKGAPFLNWLIFYPVERLCAHFTDILITINTEDYNFAKKKMKAGRVEYVPGVGISLEKYGKQGIDRARKREEISVPDDAVLILSVGELSENKNHGTVLRAIAETGRDDIYYAVAGTGSMRDELLRLARELGMEERFRLLGYREDCSELCECADIFAFPSFREGLSVSLMEAMAKGLPCAVSRIRGNTDLIDEKGGALFDPADAADCRRALEELIKGDRASMGSRNREKIAGFSDTEVKKRMGELYGSLV